MPWPCSDPKPNRVGWVFKWRFCSFLHPFVHPAIHSSVHSFVRLYFNSSINLFIHPFVLQFFLPSICSSVQTFVSPFIHPGCLNGGQHSQEGNCTVLFCTVLHCTILYCTVLYCTGLGGTQDSIKKLKYIFITAKHIILNHQDTRVPPVRTNLIQPQCIKFILINPEGCIIYHKHLILRERLKKHKTSVCVWSFETPATATVIFLMHFLNFKCCDTV